MLHLRLKSIGRSRSRRNNNKESNHELWSDIEGDNAIKKEKKEPGLTTTITCIPRNANTSVPVPPSYYPVAARNRTLTPSFGLPVNDTLHLTGSNDASTTRSNRCKRRTTTYPVFVKAFCWPIQMLHGRQYTFAPWVTMLHL